MAKETKKPSNKKKVLFKITYIVILVLALGSAGFFGFKYFTVNDKYQEAIMTQDQKNQRTVDQVAKIMDLPKDENPVIFAVQDKDKLGSAAVTKTFFEKAQNGDVILAYEKANLSIIYRPNENRIVKTDNYASFLAAANPIKIAIIAPESQQSAIEKQILEKVLNADIVTKQAPAASHLQSFVADVTGENAKAAQELAEKLSMAVSTLPSNETKPEGVSLVVVIANVDSEATP